MIFLFGPLLQLIIQNDESLAVLSGTGQRFRGLHLLSVPLLVLNQ